MTVSVYNTFLFCLFLFLKVICVMNLCAMPVMRHGDATAVNTFTNELLGLISFSSLAESIQI